MRDGEMKVALVSEVFYGTGWRDRLGSALTEARRLGAELALLPELPLNPWSPATTSPRDEDAEAPGGERHQALAEAARSAGVAVVGGAIVRDPASGRRFNTALVLDASGSLLATYAKCHIPREPGFWEAMHYGPGERWAEPIAGLGLRAGVQVCSDNNRPELSHVLGALGAEVILVPRATTRGWYENCWKPVFRANAATSSCYVLSANRPRPEQGVELGGPSIAVAPDGRVLLETEDRVAVVALARAAVEEARRDYPGYLDLRPDLYARAWAHVARVRQGTPAPA
jgi:predicted amidohydrolase